MEYDKSVVVSNQAQVRTMLQRAEANTRAFPFFLTDTMNGRRLNGTVVSLQTFCLDAMFRTSARTTPRRKRNAHSNRPAQRGYDVSPSASSSDPSSPDTIESDSDNDSDNDSESDA